MSSAGICVQPVKNFDDYVRDRVINKRSDRKPRYRDIDYEINFAKNLCAHLVTVGVLSLEDVSLIFD